MRPKGLLLVGTLVFGSACYTYQPWSPQEIGPGQTVLLRLTADEAAKYADLRLERPRQLEGTVVERTDASIEVDANLPAGPSGTGARSIFQRVDVPLSGILDVELKQFDRGRTSLLVGAGVAAVAVVAIASRGGSGTPEPGGGGTAESRRVPFLHLRLPF